MIYHYLSPTDFDALKTLKTVDLGINIKEKIKKKQEYKPFRDYILAMIFEKSSTRTRVSFEAGFKRLGGQTIVLSSKDIQLGRGETIQDTAKIISSYCDIVMIRTFEHQRLIDFSSNSSIPVINGLSDLLHPCQTLADMFTIKEHFGSFDNLKLAYVGDGNNMANSLLLHCALLGIDISVACPKDYSPSGLVVKEAIEISKLTQANIVITDDPTEAVSGANIVYTDVWASMGQEDQKEKKYSILKKYQANKELCSFADSNFIFMHCLPAHRNEEVTSDIIDGKNSVVFVQAENRLYAQMAIIFNLLNKE
ncbi:Ornithine carbamoyltransferase [Desulfurella amilsii]|uniref:Ornithine carbamoyltransferase n=1 Tax=Desulfurella amilsii TaxID=1562698 RepID=A0A1X4XUQ4_9BACT|nr:ornithine carbamoyltransferase [Desulfurella amilsii]OSS41262.1 Ornithine carbamoyltransferase [Desulfurella amilsii]